jgi:hypothetical protein
MPACNLLIYIESVKGEALQNCTVRHFCSGGGYIFRRKSIINPENPIGQWRRQA